MYMSLVTINSTDIYEQHQAIWSLFPGESGMQRDHLFRIEGERDGRQLALLQSGSEPVSSDKATVLQSKVFSPVLENGQSFKFKIVANPTKKLSKDKKVVEIQDEGEQVQWLQRKLQGANVKVTAMESRLVKSRKSGAARFVSFEGVMQLTDAEQIYQSLVTGVGRKKHAGAGLLSMARAN